MESKLYPSPGFSRFGPRTGRRRSRGSGAYPARCGMKALRTMRFERRRQGTPGKYTSLSANGKAGPDIPLCGRLKKTRSSSSASGRNGAAEPCLKGTGADIFTRARSVRRARRRGFWKTDNLGKAGPARIGYGRARRSIAGKTRNPPARRGESGSALYVKNNPCLRTAANADCGFVKIWK